MENPVKPDPQFIQSIQAGLRYWQAKTEALGPEQVQWLDGRRQNLHRAIQFGLNQPETWQDTAQLLLQAFDFSEWRGYWPEWIQVLEQALAKAPETETVLYGRLQKKLGQLFYLNSRFPEAAAQHEAVLQLAQRLANNELALMAYNGLIELYLKQNKIEQVEKYSHLALKLVETVPENERQKAHLLRSLAQFAQFVGNWHQSIEYLQKAADWFRDQGNPVYLARCLNDLGVSYLQGKDFEQAEHAFEEAGQILQATVYEMDKARIYLNLGVLFYRQKRWAEAERAFLQMDSVTLKAQQEINLLALRHNNLGNVYVQLEQWLLATENLKLAVDTFRQIKNELDLGNSLGTLAIAYAALKDQKAAARCFEEALILLRRFPNSDFAKRVMEKYEASYQALLAE